MGTRSGAAARTARVFTPWGLRVQVAGTPGGARAAGGGAAGRSGAGLSGIPLSCFSPKDTNTAV